MQRLKSLMMMGFVLLTALLLLSACSASESPACGTSADCDDDKVCREGVCHAPSLASCSIDTDCPTGGYVCVANVCSRTQADVGLPDVGPPEEDAYVPPTPDADPDAPVDINNPQVTSVSPVDGATDVAPGTTVTVTFNKPIDHGRTLNALSFYLIDPNERKVDAAISYDTNTNTATLTPTTPLLQASRYRIYVTPAIVDLSDIPLLEQYEYAFTTSYDEPELHAELAELYAPVIYQGILDTSGSGPNTDIPTRIDFDGDMIGKNNKANSRPGTANLRAHVYYHVNESDTHYFFQYVLYYATRTLDNSSTLHEHDMTGIIVVVEKESLDVVFVEGIKVEEGNADVLVSFKPSTSTVSGRSDIHKATSFDVEQLEDGSRFPLYVPSGDHMACHWYLGGTLVPRRCPHDPETFPQDKGVILRVGDTAQRYNQRTVNEEGGHDEMTYTLLPFVDTFWKHRSDLSCGLFEIAFEYSPESPPGVDNQRPIGVNGEALVLPSRLCTEDTVSFGKTPFRWAQRSGNSGGQWFMDPTYLLSARFDFGEDYSQDYCYNVFFDIDRRNEADCQE